MPAEWTDAELDLLSAYIDEQLDDSERTALEARLAQDADLRQELAAMRQTVALLRDLPTIRAPRAFTLTPEMVGQKAVPMLTVLPAAAAAPEKRARPARRMWWIPAASAAGVVLLAGIFAVTQLKNAPAAAPINGGSVAMGPTATIPQDFGSLNSVVDVRTSATTTTTATPTTTAMPTSLPAPTLERTDAKIATVQEQPPVLEDVGTADEENIIPAPPQPQQSPGTTQMPAPMGSTGQTAPSEVITEAEPRMSVSETSMAYDTQLSDAVPLVTATIDIMSLPSGGGGIITTATPDQAMEIAPANIPGPEVMAGMDGVNTDPNAPGFSVSTVAPVQETIIAQYQVDQTGYTASTTTGSVASPDASITNESASRPPIWIRWLNTLGDWLAMILGQN